jgi:glycerol-3-phosphate cytidylyltransferase
MNKKYKIGYTTGVFDLFHIGHLNILRRAKEQCEYLIVGVSTDDLVQSYKHKLPVIPFEHRKAIVEAIRYVDKVVPQLTMDKMQALEEVGFDVMFHGDDWKGTELYNNYEIEFAKKNAVIEYLTHTDGVSSTAIAEKMRKK